MRITLAQGQYGAKSNQIFPGIELDMVGDFVTEARNGWEGSFRLQHQGWRRDLQGIL
jgi:hypothetical protein